MASQSVTTKPLNPSSFLSTSVMSRRLACMGTPFQLEYEIITDPTPARTAAA